MMIRLPQWIPDMVINVCTLIKWLLSIGTNIDDRLMTKKSLLVRIRVDHITYAFLQKESVSQIHYIKLCIILGVNYFGFRRVSLAEYIPVLRVYSLLLQMTFSIRDSVSIVSTRRVMKTRSCAWSLLSYLNAFVGCDQRTSMCIWTRVCKLNYLLPHVLQDLFCNDDDSMMM